MSFTRLNYDDCTYKHLLKESISPGDYYIGMPRVDCQDCFYPSPEVRMNTYGGSVCPNVIDVDSELLNITRKKSNCPADKYIPTGKPFCETKKLKDCYGLAREDTKLSNPPCTLRGTGWNRFEWLCINPQDNALMHFDYNINNRLVVKDNHRPCVQNPIDQTASLPPMTNNDIVYDWTHGCADVPMVDVTTTNYGICENIQKF